MTQRSSISAFSEFSIIVGFGTPNFSPAVSQIDSKNMKNKIKTTTENNSLKFYMILSSRISLFGSLLTNFSTIYMKVSYDKNLQNFNENHFDMTWI